MSNLLKWFESQWRYWSVFVVGIIMMLLIFYIIYYCDSPCHITMPDNLNELDDGAAVFAIFITLFTLLITFMGIFTTITAISVTTSRDAFFEHAQ